MYSLDDGVGLLSDGDKVGLGLVEGDAAGPGRGGGLEGGGGSEEGGEEGELHDIWGECFWELGADFG